MRRFLPLALLCPFLVTGCATLTPEQKLMAAGSIAANSIDQAHAVYSDELHDRQDVCFPDRNPQSTVETKGDLDDCLGKGFNREDRKKIEIALKAFGLAGEALGVALKNRDEQQQLEAYRGVVDAALDLLALLPRGSKAAAKLKGLLEPWGF